MIPFLKEEVCRLSVLDGRPLVKLLQKVKMFIDLRKSVMRNDSSTLTIISTFFSVKGYRAIVLRKAVWLLFLNG